MQELDVLLQSYFHTGLQTASLEERQAFERLLNLPDPQLAAWLIHGKPCSDPRLAQLVYKIRAL